MRELKWSVTCSLCDQIFTLPIHWTNATNFPKTTTHASIDFSPDGLSGIGPLTARNLDGLRFDEAKAPSGQAKAGASRPSRAGRALSLRLVYFSCLQV